MEWTKVNNSPEQWKGEGMQALPGTNHQSDVCALAPGRATLEELASGDRMTTPRKDNHDAPRQNGYVTHGTKVGVSLIVISDMSVQPWLPRGAQDC